jgi:hypothetical protein
MVEDLLQPRCIVITEINFKPLVFVLQKSFMFSFVTRGRVNLFDMDVGKLDSKDLLDNNALRVFLSSYFKATRKLSCSGA